MDAFQQLFAKEGPLASPSLKINSKSTSHVQTPESTGSHACGTVLEDPILVPNDSSADERAFLDHTNQQEIEPSRLKIIKTFNVICSSIGSVFKILHKDKPPLAQHALILESFAVKRISEVALPKKQQLET